MALRTWLAFSSGSLRRSGNANLSSSSLSRCFSLSSAMIFLLVRPRVLELAGFVVRVDLVVQRFERGAAIFGAFAAHPRAAAAVRVVVAGAFGFADLARMDAGGEHRAEQLAILAGAAGGDAVSRLAHVGTVQAGADALAHVHFFRRAGVGAGIADRRAIHRVLDRLGERCVEIATDLRMLGNHLLDRHGTLLFAVKGARQGGDGSAAARDEALSWRWRALRRRVNKDPGRMRSGRRHRRGR